MLNLAERPTTENEYVVLLDEAGQPIGEADKYRIHTKDTPLHSAFSIFLFDGRGRMLVQQRAWSKKTWPGIWSNACCGHPAPGEPLEAAAQRRLQQELGLRDIQLTLALPRFRYKAEYLGVVENEICPVFIGLCEALPEPNSEEVAAIDWIDWESFVKGAPAYEDYSPWSKWEAAELRSSRCLHQLLNR